MGPLFVSVILVRLVVFNIMCLAVGYLSYVCSWTKPLQHKLTNTTAFGRNVVVT